MLLLRTALKWKLNLFCRNWTVSVSNVQSTLNTSQKPAEGSCIAKDSVFHLPKHQRYIRISELIVHTKSEWCNFSIINNQNYPEIPTCGKGDWQCPDLECIQNWSCRYNLSPPYNHTNPAVTNFVATTQKSLCAGGTRMEIIGQIFLPAVFSELFHM